MLELSFIIEGDMDIVIRISWKNPEEQAQDLKILLRKSGAIGTIYNSRRRVWFISINKLCRTV